MSKLFKFLLATLYALIPFLGWFVLYRSFKRLKANEICMLQTLNGAEILDKPGLYFNPSPFDSFSKTHDANDEHINFGAKIRVRIPPNHAGVKTTKDGAFARLNPGTHTINIDDGEQFTNNSIVNTTFATNHLYTLGNNRHIRIAEGQIGAYTKKNSDGTMVFNLMQPGDHTLSLEDQYHGCKSANESIIKFDNACTVVNLQPGYVVVYSQNGCASVHEKSGRYNFAFSAGICFEELVPMTPQNFEVDKINVTCKDQIPVEVTPLIMYKINDPIVYAASKKNNARYMDDFKKQCDAKIRAHIAQHNYEDFSASTSSQGSGQKSTNTAEELAKIKDESLRDINKIMMSLGIEVIDMSLLDINITNPALSKSVAEMATQKTIIAVKQAEAEASIKIKASEARVADQQNTMNREKTLAENNTNLEIKMRENETHNKTMAATAEAEAKATELKAQADADAIKLIEEAKAKAEKFRIESLISAFNSIDATIAFLRFEQTLEVLNKSQVPVVFDASSGNITSDPSARHVIKNNNNTLSFFGSSSAPPNESLVELHALRQFTAV